MKPQDAERFAQSHFCPDCRLASKLHARWLGSMQDGHGDYQVWCRPCGRTDGFVTLKDLGLKTPGQLWRENPDSVPVPMANRLADKYRTLIEAETEGLPPELQQAARERYLGRPPKTT
ncbi:MAG: hypothetical protein V2A73_02975 [Pseudomonadota bacterium]